MAQDIGVAYVHVEPSGKGFGKSIEGDIGDAVDKASTKSSGSLITKIGGAFGKVGKLGIGAEASPPSPPKADSPAPSTSRTPRPSSKA